MTEEAVSAAEGGLMAVVGETKAELAEIFAGMPELLVWAKGLETGRGVPEAVFPLAEGGMEGLVEAILELIEAEGGLIEAVPGMLGPEVGGSEGEAMLFPFEVARGQFLEAGGEGEGLFEEGLPCACDPFGGGGGGFGTEVGGKITEGKIGFVSDGGNEGDAGGGDSAGKGFLIEGPEVLEAAAAAADDEEVTEGIAIGGFNCADDPGGGPGSLDAGGDDNEPAGPATPLEDGNKVTQGGPAGRGDKGDGPGQAGQGLFTGFVEESLRAELFLQFEEGLLETAHAILLKGAENDLIVAARLVDGEAPGADDLQPVAEAQGEAHGVIAETDAGDGGAGILEGKVDMAGGLAPEVADFPPDTDDRIGRFEEGLDLACEGGDGVAGFR